MTREPHALKHGTNPNIPTLGTLSYCWECERDYTIRMNTMHHMYCNDCMIAASAVGLHREMKYRRWKIILSLEEASALLRERRQNKDKGE